MVLAIPVTEIITDWLDVLTEALNVADDVVLAITEAGETRVIFPPEARVAVIENVPPQASV